MVVSWLYGVTASRHRTEGRLWGGYGLGQIQFWTFRSYNKWKLDWDARKWHLAAIQLFYSESWICWLFVLGLWELRLTEICCKYVKCRCNGCKASGGGQKKEYASCARHGIERATVSIKEHWEETRCYGCYFSLTLVFWMVLGKSPCLHV